MTQTLDKKHSQQAQTNSYEEKEVGARYDREDERDKAARWQTVAMLLPRVAVELEALKADTWASTLGLSGAQETSQGRKDRGEVSEVQELHYKTEQGEFSGYFKEDKGFHAAPQEFETEVGIRQWDPNFGSRAVAMYRLDQLLEAGVTAKVEFAVHEGKLGTTMESAKGTKAGETPLVLRDDGKGQVPGAVSLEDATLQRCLNKLQILDAIAGQLDRHAGNYFIQHDQGKVTGVTGIDLDMAFGRDMTTPDSKGAARMARNFRGLPEQLDEDFARKILSIDEGQVREALKGLLHPSEVEATVARFRRVTEAITQAQNSGLLVSNWDSQSAQKALGDEPKFESARSYYAHDLALSAGESMERVARPVISDWIEILSMGGDLKLKKDFTDLLLPSDAQSPDERSPIAKQLFPLIYSGTVMESEIERFINRVMAQLGADDDWTSEVRRLSQEHEKIIPLGHGTSKAITAAIERVLAGWKVPAKAGK